MKASFISKAAIAALALGGAGSAFANTALTSTNGDIVLGVYDATNGDSFVFDTGLNSSTFNGAGSYSYSLSGDANYQAFIAAVGSDDLQFDVVGVQRQNSGAATVGDAAFTTAGGLGATPLNSKVIGATSTGQNYYAGVNLWASATANSAFVNTGSDLASFAPFESSWSSNLGLNDLGQVGSALNFYSFTANNTRSGNSTLTSFIGQWNLSGGSLTYGGGVAPVPVPASWTLLLSGLALMLIVSRRGKSSEGDTFSGTAA